MEENESQVQRQVSCRRKGKTKNQLQCCQRAEIWRNLLISPILLSHDGSQSVLLSYVRVAVEVAMVCSKVSRATFLSIPPVVGVTCAKNGCTKYQPTWRWWPSMVTMESTRALLERRLSWKWCCLYGNNIFLFSLPIEQWGKRIRKQDMCPGRESRRFTSLYQRTGRAEITTRASRRSFFSAQFLFCRNRRGIIPTCTGESMCFLWIQYGIFFPPMNLAEVSYCLSCDCPGESLPSCCLTFLCMVWARVVWVLD